MKEFEIGTPFNLELILDAGIPLKTAVSKLELKLPLDIERDTWSIEGYEMPSSRAFMWPNGEVKPPMKLGATRGTTHICWGNKSPDEGFEVPIKFIVPEGWAHSLDSVYW